MKEKRILFHCGSKGPERVCSNFYVCDPPLIIDGKTFPTVEHYYQSSKFAASDPNEAEVIRRERTALSAKRAAEKYHEGFDIRVWERSKGNAIMLKGLCHKAEQCKEFGDFLFKHKECEFIDASPYDYIWGCGRHGTGLNKIGVMIADIAQTI